MLAANVDLAAAVRLLPNHDQVHDITGGLGTAVYDFDQSVLDQLSRAIVNGVSLTALAQAAGIDPKSLVNGLLAQLPANLLPGIIGQLGASIPIPILSTALGQAGVAGLLTNVLNLLGVSDITNSTLSGLLAVIGLNLSDPLNLSGLAVPGLNVVTSGSPFALLKMLGLDLGWTPALPNSVAAEINGTPYLQLGVKGALDLVLGKVNTLLAGDPLNIPLAALSTSLQGVVDGLTNGLPDVIDARVIPTVGVGLGAFAAAMAYKQVLAQLASQPGGAAYTGTDPVLGSLTVLPLILINNPGRPDGGAIARFGALASLLGIDSVNPTTHLTGSINPNNPLGSVDPLGLTLGGANVLPVLVDATYEYQPLSDLASWPNAFTLLNNLAAGLSPTYMLRGLSLAGLDTQLTNQISTALGNATALNPLALNLYVTLPSATLPLLEPLYLASDALNLVGVKPLADFATHLANALAPALTTLVNLGYADTTLDPQTGLYVRDFSTAGTETPFLSFPDVNFPKALSDSFNQLVSGFQKEFFSGNPTPGGPNVLKNLVDALLNGSLLSGGVTTGAAGTSGGTVTNPLGGLGSLLGGLLGGLGLVQHTATTAVTTAATTSASSVPQANAKLLSVAPAGTEKTADTTPTTPSTTETPSTTKTTSTTPSTTKTPSTTATTADPTTTKTAESTTATDPDADTSAGSTAADGADKGTKGPKHAKPDGDSASTSTDASTSPKHAKGPKHAKPSGGDQDATTAGTSASDATSGGTTGAGKKAKGTGHADAGASSGSAGGSAAGGKAA
ncbi:hypothetical protein MMAD_53080 [Mycolicibacterium madagascariense]|uniref:ATPase AAA n=1 Tax=Mycolicibacterium madagascariense TaxID=212765 RepID=A0A7I7XPJ2_9MYCO|nr:hypothetical protein MMAD_53080 [Mycolicibacterium madagascariense]